MSDAPPPDAVDVPSRRAPSPRWPALVPRRPLFVGLLILYLIVVGALIAMSVVEHAHPS